MPPSGVLVEKIFTGPICIVNIDIARFLSRFLLLVFVIVLKCALHLDPHPSRWLKLDRII